MSKKYTFETEFYPGSRVFVVDGGEVVETMIDQVCFEVGVMAHDIYYKTECGLEVDPDDIFKTKKEAEIRCEDYDVVE